MEQKSRDKIKAILETLNKNVEKDYPALKEAMLAGGMLSGFKKEGIFKEAGAGGGSAGGSNWVHKQFVPQQKKPLAFVGEPPTNDINKLVAMMHKYLNPGTDRGSSRAIIDVNDFKPLAAAIVEYFIPITNSSEQF